MARMKQSQNSNVVCVACAISVVFLFGHSVWSAPPKASGTSYTGDAADTLVSEALQREVYGLQVERNELLQGALEKDADHQAANKIFRFVRRFDTGKYIASFAASERKSQLK